MVIIFSPVCVTGDRLTKGAMEDLVPMQVNRQMPFSIVKTKRLFLLLLKNLRFLWKQEMHYFETEITGSGEGDCYPKQSTASEHTRNLMIGPGWVPTLHTINLLESMAVIPDNKIPKCPVFNFALV